MFENWSSWSELESVCVPEENSLDIQKVVLAQSLHCTFKKQYVWIHFPACSKAAYQVGCLFLVCFYS